MVQKAQVNRPEHNVIGLNSPVFPNNRVDIGNEGASVSVVAPEYKVSNEQLGQLGGYLVAGLKATAVASYFNEVATGPFQAVCLNPSMSYLPYVLGNDGEPVFIYNVVAEWQSMTDYDELLERFPTVSYMQLSRTLDFVRKIMQFNTRRIDLDSLVDNEVESDPEFQALMIASVNDQERNRVLGIR